MFVRIIFISILILAKKHITYLASTIGTRTGNSLLPCRLTIYLLTIHFWMIRRIHNCCSARQQYDSLYASRRKFLDRVQNARCSFDGRIDEVSDGVFEVEMIWRRCVNNVVDQRVSFYCLSLLAFSFTCSQQRAVKPHRMHSLERYLLRPRMKHFHSVPWATRR